MKINLIAAMSENRVIGKDGEIPWKISGDLKRFKKITMGSAIIMGRKTFESIGSPLPGRQNFVLTRQKDYKAEGVEVVHSIKEFLNLPYAPHHSEALFVIGGEEVYRAFLSKADRIYLTLVKGTYEGDAYFPKFPELFFNEIENEAGKGEPEHRYVILERIKN